MARYTAKIRGQGALPKIVKSGAERGIQIDFESPMLETRVAFGGPGGDAMTIWARRPGDAPDAWRPIAHVTASQLGTPVTGAI